MQTTTKKYIFEYFLRGTESFPTEVVISADGLDEAKKKAEDIVSSELSNPGVKLTLRSIVESSIYERAQLEDGKGKRKTSNN